MRFRRDEHPDELISAALAGDLSAAERSALNDHLAGCERCRATRAAFTEERRLLGSLHHAAPPRDMGARIRSAIEANPAVPWWRRTSTLVGAFASVATVAAAVLAVLVLSDIPRGPIGATQDPTPSASLVASAAPSAEPTAPPDESAAPTPIPQVALDPGELGYLTLESEPFQPGRLFFVKESTGEAMEASAPSGPPTAAAISPTGEWLAYITEIGGAGVNQVWVLHLTDGSTQVLGCSVPNPFTERLAWSDDGRFLAYTLTQQNPGGGVDCGGVEGDGTATDVWLFDAAATGEHVRLTDEGNAFAGDFMQSLGADGGYRLLVSYAGQEPYTQEVRVGGSSEDEQLLRLDDTFLPLVAPNGLSSLFWRGEMAQDGSGAWRFARGGMPYVTTEVDAAEGEPLFADLQLPGGEGFASGRMAWGDDSDLFAFWSGDWSGAPQDAEGTYPSVQQVYVGRLTEGLITKERQLALELGEGERVIDVALGPAGISATVTVAQASGGVGDPPSATLLQVPLANGDPVQVGEPATAKPWNGPGVYGEEPVALPN